MTAPPRLARRLVERTVHGHLADAVLGDLAELFAADCSRDPRRARFRYWRRALDAAWQLRGPRLAASAPRGDSLMHMLWKDAG